MYLRALARSRLTIHSSRRRFAARLNSSVRRLDFDQGCAPRAVGYGMAMTLYRAARTIAAILFVQAVIATLIVLVTSERTVDDFQRVFMTVGGACAAVGILAMGSSRWSGEMG